MFSGFGDKIVMEYNVLVSCICISKLYLYWFNFFRVLYFNFFLLYEYNFKVIEIIKINI